MTYTTYDTFEEYMKASLARYPEDIEELQQYLQYHKDELFTCKGCQTQPDFIATLTCTRISAPAINNADEDHDGAISSTTSTISILLPELLLETFSFLSLKDPPLMRETWDASETRILSTPHLGWIHVTHVCRRWRHLGTQTAALWTNLSHGLVLGSSWTKIFLSRAKGANISIPQFDDYPQSLDMICDYITDHSVHIRDVTLSAEWTSMQTIWAFCDLYLPMTVSANLDAGRHNWHVPVLFRGYAPNLKYLRLCNIAPWRSHTFLENLIELDVFMCDDVGSSKNRDLIAVAGEVEPIPQVILPPLEQVLDVLDETSNLEHLSLHYAIPEEDSVDEARRVHLPRLKSFSMANKVRSCASFLQRIVFPHNATLDLTCIPGLSSDKFQDLFRALAHHAYSAGDERLPVERLELGSGRFDDRALLRVYGGHTDTEQTSDDTLTRNRLGLSHLPQRPMITLSLAYASPQDHEVILQYFFSLMPLQSLVYLNIYGCWTIQSESWRTVIRDSHAHLQSVHFLVLGHDCAQFFFHAIHDGDDTLSGFGPPAFPNLDRLVFRRVDFSMFSRGDVSEASFQDQMLYHLRDRIRRGKPLRAVFFFSCQGVEEEWFRDLEKVVKFVRLGL